MVLARRPTEPQLRLFRLLWVTRDKSAGTGGLSDHSRCDARTQGRIERRKVVGTMQPKPSESRLAFIHVRVSGVR